MQVPSINVHELKKLIDQKADILILDVRNQNEYDLCHLNGHLIPLQELPTRMNELNRDQMIIVHCHGGGRSSRAVAFLLEAGFSNVKNLSGGITAWANEIDQTMAKY